MDVAKLGGEGFVKSHAESLYSLIYLWLYITITASINEGLIEMICNF